MTNETDCLDQDSGPPRETPVATEIDTALEPSDRPVEIPTAAAQPRATRRFPWPRVLLLGVAALLAIALVGTAAVLWWHGTVARDDVVAQSESMASARDATAALLSYQPDKVEAELHAAGALLTGSFKDSYAQLTNDVVIPGAQQKQIASLATVSAVASVSASPRLAVNLVFVDQNVTVGNGAPTSTSSAIRVTSEKVGNRWLISAFDPI